MQVVQVADGIECELARSRPLVEGGPYEIIVISDVPANSLTMHDKLVLVPAVDVIELTEEQIGRGFGDGERRWVSQWRSIDGD